MKSSARRNRPAARHTSGDAPLRRTDRRRGSVLLLVVVSIVLMTIIGATYLQVARVDRFSMAQIEFSSGDIEVNVGATRVLIEQMLRDDILEFDNSGDAFFLSPDDQDGDDRGDESYDYPWTNAALPGHLDDMWLAATTPRFVDDDPATYGNGRPDGPVWPHLSTGLNPVEYLLGTEGVDYLVLPRAEGNQTLPVEYHDFFPAFTQDGDTLRQLHTNVPMLEGNSDGELLQFENDANWDRLGADADQDGVPDARWMYAPVRQVGDTEYVWAVRIIDNSSLLNINTATFMTGALPASRAANPPAASVNAFDVNSLDDNRMLPRGYVPTDFDLARLAYRVLQQGSAQSRLPANDVADELDLWMTTRGLSPVAVGNPYYALGLLTDTSGTPTDAALVNPELDPQQLPFGLNLRNNPTTNPRIFDLGLQGRFASYLAEDGTQGGIYTASTVNRYGPEDETELRRGNGINSNPDETTVEDPDNLQLITRNGINDSSFDSDPLPDDSMRAAELVRDFIPSIGTSDADRELALSFYFRGGGDDSVTSYADRDFPAVRQMLTTYNGVDTLVPNYDRLGQSTSVNDPQAKFSLLTGAFDWSTSNPGEGSYDANERFNRLYSNDHTGIRDVFRLRSVGAPATRYLDAASDLEADAYAAALAAAIVDAMDDDANPTESAAIDGVRYYGTEQLPVLREVFAQVAYESEDLLDETGSGGSDGFYETWTRADDSAGLAIEIGNPFDREIDLGNIDLRIQIVQGSTLGATYEVNVTGATLAPSDSDPTTDDDDDQYVLYIQPRNRVTGDNGTGNDMRADLSLDAMQSGELVGGGSDPFDAGGSDIVVQLQADISGSGSWVTYDELVISWNAPTSYEHPDQVAFIEDSMGADAGEVPASSGLNTFFTAASARDGRGLYYLTSFSDAAGASGIDHASPIGGNSGIHILKNSDGSGVETYNRLVGGSGGRGRTSDVVSSLGEDVKTVGGREIDAEAGFRLALPSLPVSETIDTYITDTFALSIPDHPLMHIADIATVFMLGFTNDTTTSPPTVASITERITETIAAHPGEVVTLAGAPTTNIPGYLEWHRYAYLDISPVAASAEIDRDGDGDLAFDAFAAGVPHAALLFDRLSLLDPERDFRNNDGDVDNASADLIDEDDPALGDRRAERLLPGVMNINTVDPLLAALVSPLPEDLNDAEGLFRAIAAYRDHPDWRTVANGYPDGLPNNPEFTGATRNPDYRPGIASIGELLFVNDPERLTVDPGNLTRSQSGVIQQIGRDGDPMNYDRITSTGSPAPGSPEWYDRYDVSPLPEVQLFEEPNRTVAQDKLVRRATTDGPEERTARFRNLANVFSTRSDVFTAYVVIRGYRSGLYNEGVIESAHYIAVFDRSGLLEATTPLRLVAYERVF